MESEPPTGRLCEEQEEEREEISEEQGEEEEGQEGEEDSRGRKWLQWQLRGRLLSHFPLQDSFKQGLKLTPEYCQYILLHWFITERIWWICFPSSSLFSFSSLSPCVRTRGRSGLRLSLRHKLPKPGRFLMSPNPQRATSAQPRTSR